MFFLLWNHNSSIYVHFDHVVGQNDFYGLGVDKEFLLFFFTRVAYCSLTWICFPESIEASFWIFSNLFSNRVLLLWIFSNLSTCDFLSSFNSLICSSSSWLRFLSRWFFSYFFIIFPLKSSLTCFGFRISFNFLIFVTNVLLWFFSWNTSSVLFVYVLLLFVISNLCALLMSLYFCWSSFICYWCWHISNSWLFNFLWNFAISSSLSFKCVSSFFSLKASTSFLIPWFCDFLFRHFNLRKQIFHLFFLVRISRL